MDKQKMRERQEKILALTDGFCKEKLNQEYRDLATRMVQKIGRKKDVPFVSGKTEVWAAAVIHALGTINFLFDKNSQPYSTVDEINDFFGTKKSTVASKSKIIRDLLKLGYFNTEFSLQQVNESNPLNEMVMVDGFIVSIDSLPPDVQEIARRALAEGKEIYFETQ